MVIKHPLPHSSRILRFRNHMPKPGSPEQTMDALMRCENMLGLRLRENDSEPPKYIDNFAVDAQFGPIGPKVFLHGRDIFPSKDIADAYYASGKDNQKLLRNINPRARDKVMYAYSEATFEQRLLAYATPQDRKMM